MTLQGFVFIYKNFTHKEGYVWGIKKWSQILTTWMDLDGIMLSQTEKDKYCILEFTLCVFSFI